MSVEHMNIEMLASFRYLVEKLVYHGDSGNFMEKRKLILSELTRFYHDYNNQTVNVDSYKHVFKLRKYYCEWFKWNNYEICSTNHWSLNIDKDRIKNLLEYLISEGINVDEYNVTYKGGETSLARGE